MSRPADLAIVVVSTNEAHWLEPCLRTTFEHAGNAVLDVVVVDNASTDGTRHLVEERFPQARLVSCANHGFGHANNRGAVTCDARYVLFLNPDTEIVRGTFGELLELMDARPEIGLTGVRQLTGDGTLWPTMRRFPSPLRALGEALGSSRWPGPPNWAGELERDMDRYERGCACDWTSGSFMLCRREALLGGGLMDERFFIYCEEPDLSLRMKRAGWQTHHLPSMTIVHHAGKGGIRPRMIAQDAFARGQYARKHFGPVRRAAYLAAVALRHALRALAPGRGAEQRLRRQAGRTALATLAGRLEPPFGAPPPTALAPGAALMQDTRMTPALETAGDPSRNGRTIERASA
ncbi:MAG TPA: glycosyltransferase family 2 protein [Solirubrobacteraceae bacterium]|jgi:GT2 family glycosyltransferase|nr:glycosyltransferase family 2 protein [Solirubrobacteraceae bacterium]